MVFSWFEGSVEEASARGLGRGIGGSPVSPQATARRAMATPAALSAYRGLVGRGEDRMTMTPTVGGEHEENTRNS
jgi:hypothetical protein